MLDEPFNIYKLLNITPADGYKITETCQDIALVKCKLIYISHNIQVHQLGEYNIYCARIDHRTEIVNHNSISDDDLESIIEKFSTSGRLYYKKYNEKGEDTYGKEIVTDYNILPDKKLLIDNIKAKIDKHPKLTINLLLYGEPGTGKSSFVEYVANVFQRNVHVLPICKNTMLSKVIDKISACKDRIVLIPEIDKILDDFGNPIHSENELYEFLDGSNRPVGSVIIMTCNDVSKFKRNTVLTRPGRIHFELEFKNVEMSDIEYIVKRYYPDFNDFSIFTKYVGKVSHAEINTAVCQHYIMDKKITNKFAIQLKTQKIEQADIYY